MSFFGFDAKLPQDEDFKTEERTGEESDDAFNDETFGVDVSNIKNDFNFASGFPAPSSSSNQVFTVDEIESQLKNAHIQKAFTLSEIESELKASPSPVAVSPANADQIAAEEWSVIIEKDKGLMSRFEKELVYKIQLGHLTSDPNYHEDYYYTRLEHKKSEHLPTQEETIVKENQKFGKLLAEAKAYVHSKSEKTEISGTLGKIVRNSLSKPKQLMNIEPKPLVENEEGQKEFSFKHVLRSIENIYSHILQSDEIFYEYQKEQKTGTINQENQKSRNVKYTTIVKNLWKELFQIAPNSDLPEDFLNAAPPEKNLSLLFSYSKGRKSLPRILKILKPDQILLLMKSILLSLKNVIIFSQDPVVVLSDLEEYSNFVVFPFVPLISELKMSTVLEMFQLLLENDTIKGISKTKPGILLLTLFISRAEIIRQSGNQEAAPEIKDWESNYFPKIFSSFSSFSALFPPAQIIPPIVTGSSTIPQPISIDDQYVWQFLAALALGAPLEQQRILVSDLRDKIFQTVSMQGAKGTQKVNILLHALGLDASQLSA